MEEGPGADYMRKEIHMRKVTKGISALLAVVMAGLCTACGGGGSGKGASTASTKYKLIEDLGGYEFTIADEADSLFHAPVAGKDELNDAALERIKQVEQSYNCKIKVVETDQIEQFDIMLPRLLSGEKYADVVVSTFYNMGKFISAGVMTDLASLSSIKLDQPYWEQATLHAAQIGNKIFAAAPAYLRNTRSAPVVFFNKRLVQELGLEDPYQLVADKKWTWDKYIEMAKAATKDLDGNGVMDWSDQWGISAADPYGDHAVALFGSSGLKMLDRDADGKIQYVMNNSKTIDVLTKMKQMILKSNAMALKEDNSNGQVWIDQFTAGKALFLQHTFYTLQEIAAMDDDFGLLPMPMGPYASDYISTLGHNTLTMGIPVNNPNIDKVSKILNALAEGSQADVDAYESMIKKRYLRDGESWDVYENMKNKYMSVDYAALCWLANTDIDGGTRGLVSNCVRNLNTEPASTLASVAQSCSIAVNDFWNK